MPNGQLVAALREIVLAGEQYQVAAAKELGLTVTEAQAVSYLMARGPMIQRRLGELLYMGGGSVTSLVDRLERRGLVRRTADPTDRRRSVVELADTDSHVVEHLSGWLVDVADGIPASDRPVLTTQLNQLAGTLRTRNERGSNPAA